MDSVTREEIPGTVVYCARLVANGLKFHGRSDGSWYLALRIATQECDAYRKATAEREP